MIPVVCPCFLVSISIHAPREGSDGCRLLDYLADVDGFLSTLPARGATLIFFVFFAVFVFLSTLPARGATLRIPRG